MRPTHREKERPESRRGQVEKYEIMWEEKWIGWGWSNTLALKVLRDKLSFFLLIQSCVSHHLICFIFFSLLFSDFLCKSSPYPHQGRLPITTLAPRHMWPSPLTFTDNGLYEIVSVWLAGGGKRSRWSKLVREQVVGWHAENYVLQVCCRMICDHYHHVHETIWHCWHILCPWEGKGKVEKWYVW